MIEDIHLIMVDNGLDFKMRVTVRRLLKKYGYPPDLQKEAVETVVKQAEMMAQMEFKKKT
ncbi:protein of unknown function [Bacillus sp. OV322]|nr:protein of unknown function [Bacillus sp. OV322]